MTPKDIRNHVAASCGFNKAQQGIWDEKSQTWIRPSGTVQQGRRPMFKPFPNDDDTCPKCGSTVCTHIWELDAQQGEPTSFSAWLEANQDSIEMPLDRTEATTQWFDQQGEQETCAYTEFVEALDQLREANEQQGS